MKPKERKVLLRALRPPCFGKFDCLIVPDPGNFFLPIKEGVNQDKEGRTLEAVCLWIDECQDEKREGAG